MKKFTTKLIFGAVYIVLFAGNLCAAQTNANWGESVRGAQMSIALSNNVFEVGSAITISATIQNLSTNAAKMIESGVTTDFIVTLTSNSGKEYRLTPDTSKWPHTLHYVIKINPGENHTWKIPVAIPKDINDGDYTLKAITTHLGFKLESNMLAIHVNGSDR